MAISTKHESIVAFRIEPGKDVGGSPPSDGWGDASSIQTLGSGDALSITESSVIGETENVEDESIEGAAFKNLPVQTKLGATGGLGGNVRLRNMDKLLYWMLGFEKPGESPITACQFTITSAISVDPSVGDIYSNNTNEFTITGLDLTAGVGTIYTKRTTGSGSPETSGDLVRVSGSGDDPIAFSATSDIYYSHMFELDRHERAFLPYRASNPDEQTAGDYNAGDRKCRMATIAQKRATNDFRYGNAMCARFSFSMAAGELMKWSVDIVAYQQERGDYSSSSWTFASGGSGSQYLIPHHLIDCEVGTAGSFSAINISDLEFSCEIPLQILQDTESGLYIAEPEIEAMYDVNVSGTISRHTADTFLGYRDNWNELALKLTATKSTDQLKILIQDLVVNEASVSDDGVSNLPFAMKTGPKTSATTPFTFELEGHTVTQNSPILIITNNQNSTNEMQRE